MSSIVSDYDLLPCSVLKTDPSNKVVYCSKKFSSCVNTPVEEILNRSMDSFLTKASKILFQQITLPLVLHTNAANEVQLNFVGKKENKVPMVVFASRDSDPDGNITWCCFPAEERNKLLDELRQSKKELEDNNALLKNLSKTDSLTGCLNRRETLCQLSAVRRRNDRRKTCIGILMLDLDHFKAVNDNYGHSEGDAVLTQFSQLLMENARIDDVVGRYGGEEFIVLLPDIDDNGLLEAAERIHGLMKNIRSKASSITVSIGGYSVVHGSKETDQELIDLADTALYESKKTGRSKTTLLSQYSLA